MSDDCFFKASHALVNWQSHSARDKCVETPVLAIKHVFFKGITNFQTPKWYCWPYTKCYLQKHVYIYNIHCIYIYVYIIPPCSRSTNSSLSLCISLHYITWHDIDVALHCIALDCITLPYVTYIKYQSKQNKT